MLRLDRFGGSEDSEKLVETIRSHDEDAISTYVTSMPNPSEILIAAILFASHETPYSHSVSGGLVELIRKVCTPDVVIRTIMSFWRDRPATGTVLVMKFVDLEILGLGDVVTWLLGEDEWMRKCWGWEMLQICVEKVDGLHARRTATADGGNEGTIEAIKDENVEENAEDKPVEEKMEVDFVNGGINGTAVNDDRKELFVKIVAGVGACYERQTVLDKEWLKEWFGMVVRKYSADLVGLKGEGWVAEMLTQTEEYRKYFI